MSSAGMLAFGFLNPALVWGVGLAGVPILIHLLSRRYVRRVEWGATRFLLMAERKTRRRVRFEQWLLVALRCLALTLLALVLARPFVRPGLIAALLGGRGQVARIVILDDSASMSYRIGAAAEFERLKKATGRLLSWLRQEAPHDPVLVYLTSAGGAPLVQETYLTDAELADLRARIARLEPVEMAARPGRAIAATAEREWPAGAKGADYYVLSDFQQTDWVAAGTDGRSAFAPLSGLGGFADQPDAARQASDRSSAKPAMRSVRAVLIASGVQPRGNVALVDVQLERPQTIAGFPAVVRVKLANHASQTVSDVVLQADIDGAPLPATPIGAIEAGQQKTFSLEVTFADEGTHVLTLTLGPVDSFRADDTHRQTVEVKAALAVLLVNGAPGADEYRDESFLLRSALSPPGPLSSGVHVDVIDPEQVRVTDLDRYDAILLCNVSPPDEVTAGGLSRFVRSGGGLAIFLGSEVGDPQEYNRALFAGRSGLLPAALESLVSPPGEGGGVGLLRTEPHPVTAAFPAGSDALSEYVHFWRYYRCAEGDPTYAGRGPQSPAVILARYADQSGTAAIIERAVGRGRVLLFTSTADLEWNDWARAPDGSYVVTMLELVQYLARRTVEPGFFITGEPLSVTLSPERYEPAAFFKSPAFPNEPPFAAATAAPPDPEAPLVVPGPIATRLGTYSVELSPRPQPGTAAAAAERPVCVNLDPAESDLSVASPAALDAALAGIPHELVPSADEFLESAEQTRQELWPALLILLVMTLMSEQLLAWWFGKPRTGSGLTEIGGALSRGRRRFASLRGRYRRSAPLKR